MDLVGHKGSQLGYYYYLTCYLNEWNNWYKSTYEYIPLDAIGIWYEICLKLFQFNSQVILYNDALVCEVALIIISNYIWTISISMYTKYVGAYFQSIGNRRIIIDVLEIKYAKVMSVRFYLIIPILWWAVSELRYLIDFWLISNPFSPVFFFFLKFKNVNKNYE